MAYWQHKGFREILGYVEKIICPILMTSLATIAAILPLALGIGAGSEVRQPMGIAIMGGFTTSTLLTLVVVPVIFSYIDNLQNWIKDTLRYGFDQKASRP